MHAHPPLPVLLHTDPSRGDPDDDYAAILIKALVDEGQVDLVGVVVNRQPARERAEQFGSTLAALGVHRHGHPVPVGIGASHIGRPMGPVPTGAPDHPAPPPIDAHDLQRRALAEADDGSLVVLVTTAATDLDWLMTQDTAPRKIRAILMMGDAVPAEPGTGDRWAPGDAVNNLVDQHAARRVFARLQTPAWRHVTMTVVSRWAAFAGGQVRPDQLDDLARANPAAAWLRDRVAASMNERWTAFNNGEVAGRTRATFVANHLGGTDPGRRPDESVFDLVTAIPIYDALVPLAACEPELFAPTVDRGAPNFRVIGLHREQPGVPDGAALHRRLVELLTNGVGAASRPATTRPPRPTAPPPPAPDTTSAGPRASVLRVPPPVRPTTPPTR